MGEKNRAEPASNIENRLRSLRTAKALSQGTLASIAGITRQAVCAIEANQYLPTTAVALRLAGALDCRVEDLFSLVSTGEVIEGDLVGSPLSGPGDSARVRVKVVRVGDRMVVRPVATLGEVLNYTIPADGLILGSSESPKRGAKDGAKVRVQLLRDRRSIEQEIAVAGCDPAIFLAGEYLRRKHEKTTLVEWNLGSAAAVEALKRREVHMAGLHIVDAKSGESNLPYLRRHLKDKGFTVITFATWEEGLMVHHNNPKGIREVPDLSRKDVVLVNREEGAGARLLLDQRLVAAGIKSSRVKGYERIANSHFEVARLVAEGQADVGIGVWSAARLMGLDFIPLQEERYDLVVPTPYLTEHPGISNLLATIVSRPFRTEIEALGGYDTRDTGKIHELHGEHDVK
jgi:molybdate-binding protein/DNA-binding XRE family transcriptional regulator